MKIAFQLAYRNLIGAGLRTWLNVGVLAFTFFIIVFYNGILDGWNNQARRDTIQWEYGFGQVHHPDYNPYDPFTIQDGHGNLENEEHLTPILIQQGSLYPGGRMISLAVKGISREQDILNIPSAKFKTSDAQIPAVIGQGFAKSANLEVGDEVLLRWRDQNGTFDAANVTIIDVFKTTVPMIDRGQIWVPIETLWEMTGLNNEASIYIADENYEHSANSEWTYLSQADLLKDLDEIIATKKTSSMIIYGLLLAIALLAIFDTQVLSVFRRQKEIGTYISLGMTRAQVVTLFTVEGSMYSFFAMIVGIILGMPIMWYLAKTGIAFPTSSSADMGISIAERIYPEVGFGLLVSTVALVTISATIVSFLPAKKIAKMNPIDALKGKLQ